MTKQQRASYHDSVVRCRSIMFDLEHKVNLHSVKRVKKIYKQLEELEAEIIRSCCTDE